MSREDIERSRFRHFERRALFSRFSNMLLTTEQFEEMISNFLHTVNKVDFTEYMNFVQLINLTGKSIYANIDFNDFYEILQRYVLFLLYNIKHNASLIYKYMPAKVKNFYIYWIGSKKELAIDLKELKQIREIAIHTRKELVEQVEDKELFESVEKEIKQFVKNSKDLSKDDFINKAKEIYNQVKRYWGNEATNTIIIGDIISLFANASENVFKEIVNLETIPYLMSEVLNAILWRLDENGTVSSRFIRLSVEEEKERKFVFTPSEGEDITIQAEEEIERSYQEYVKAIDRINSLFVNAEILALDIGTLYILSEILRIVMGRDKIRLFPINLLCLLLGSVAFRIPVSKITGEDLKLLFYPVALFSIIPVYEILQRAFKSGILYNIKIDNKSVIDIVKEHLKDEFLDKYVEAKVNLDNIEVIKELTNYVRKIEDEKLARQLEHAILYGNKYHEFLLEEKAKKLTVPFDIEIEIDGVKEKLFTIEENTFWRFQFKADRKVKEFITKRYPDTKFESEYVYIPYFQLKVMQNEIRKIMQKISETGMPKAFRRFWKEYFNKHPFKRLVFNSINPYKCRIDTEDETMNIETQTLEEIFPILAFVFEKDKEYKVKMHSKRIEVKQKSKKLVDYIACYFTIE